MKIIVYKPASSCFFYPRYIESDENLCLRGDKLREILLLMSNIFDSASELNFTMIHCLRLLAVKVNFKRKLKRTEAKNYA